MNPDDIVRFTSQAMLVCLLASLPAIVASAVIGLLVAFIQAVTSLQDASISHGIKLLIVSAVIAVTASWSAARIVHFSQTLLQAAFRP
ncbi:type III secretion system export apparatus subunit SctS [Xylophilus sp. GOD-11R]|uniref:type III secretion system export apparatus subunit SctS n=1 Tax=Xylophilus sp. GOD-11R TaxID=3089814 RepID=UPI00298D0560|nr:type III secretion system export apparatus subunit SctS [Xylophilus sp. GOD-11R]WPB57932.1 type III secretion system export apparatus subunit SctS [Xylophilus sp. GOD-11R]